MKSLFVCLLACAAGLPTRAAVVTNNGWRASVLVSTNIAFVGETVNTWISVSPPPADQLPRRWDPSNVIVEIFRPLHPNERGIYFSRFYSESYTNEANAGIGVNVIDFNISTAVVISAAERVAVIATNTIVSQPALAAEMTPNGLGLSMRDGNPGFRYRWQVRTNGDWVTFAESSADMNGQANIMDPEHNGGFRLYRAVFP